MIREEALKILGLSDDMAENIKKSYLRLSRENHPDTGGDAEMFKKIHEAYMFLSEMEQPPSSRHEDVHLNVSISLEEAIFGVTVEMHIRPTMISSTPMIGHNKAVASADVITVVENIPPMKLLQSGSMTLTYKEKILHGAVRDIHITYSIRTHDRYKHRQNKFGPLLEAEEVVPVTAALYGGTIEVKTLYGIRKLFIKPGTNIGDIYEIKNHGPLGSLQIKISGISMPPTKEVDPSVKAMIEKAELEISKEEEEIERNKKAAGMVI